MNKQQSMRRSHFPFGPRGVAPEIFQTIKGAFVPVKDMDNNLQIIEHDPLAGRKSVNRHRSKGMVLSQSRFNFIRDGFKLRLGRSGANHEKIGERRDRAQVHDNNIFRLFVRGELRADFC
jgi:hypothetical protein